VGDKVIEFGSEFDWVANEPFLREIVELDSLHTHYYRSGRDALKEIAVCNKGTHNSVLLPTLCCESMVIPFTQNGYKAKFFKLNEDLSANLDDLISKVDEHTVLVYIHYFGMTSLRDEQLAQLKNNHPQMIMVEDRTHDIIVHRTKTAFSPDYMIASMRKWFALPDGGIIASIRKVNDEKPAPEFSNIRLKAFKNKSEYLSFGNESLKGDYRHALNEAAVLLDADPHPYGMTEESRKLLSSMDMDGIYRARLTNVEALESALTGLVEAGEIKYLSSHAALSTLYFPILLDNRDAVQHKLTRVSIYCPVIWPVIETAKGVCKFSEYVADHMLALPCDQRYTPADMQHIAEAIKTIL